MAETMSSNSCRICMSSKMHHSSIFSNDLSRKITEIADVEVQEGDGLPPTICEDCEVDLDKCYKFRVQIQWADSKFRENLSVSEVVFEECQIKQEIAPMHPFMNEDNQDNEDDDDDRGPSDNDDDDYDMREEPEDKTENADKEGNQVTHPLDHVEIIENRTKQEIHMPLTDQNSQEEPLIVAQNMKSENEPTTDPLMHNEPQSMETDNILPGPSTSAPMVSGSEHPIQVASWASAMNAPINILGERQPFTSVLPGIKVQEPLTDLRSRLTSQVFLPGQSTQGTSSSSILNLPLQHILPSKDLEVRPVFIEGVNVGNVLVIKTAKPNQPTNSTQMNSDAFVPIVKKPQLDFSKETTLHMEASSAPYDFEMKNYPSKPVWEDQNISQAESQSKKAPKSQEKTILATEKDIKTFKVHDETTCFVCDLSFIENDLLLEHLKATKLFCRNCTNIFNTHSDLEKHFTSYKGFKCTTCEEIFFSIKDSIKHFKLNKLCDTNKIKVACKVCGNTFSRNSALNNHMRTVHPTGKGIKCLVCGKYFHSQTQITFHQKTVHVAYELVSCRQCHELYLGPEKLKTHIQNVHLDALKHKIFKCQICDKIFKTANSLKSHSHDRTEVLCEHCGQSITGGRPAMYYHLRSKHPEHVVTRKINKQKIQKTCKVCLESFDSQDKLRDHQKQLHPELEKLHYCEICGKGFKVSNCLKLHYNVHSDERNFKCEVCGASFKQQVTLRTHSRIHSDILKYTCDFCGKSFRWKQTFDKHVAKCKDESDSDD